MLLRRDASRTLRFEVDLATNHVSADRYKQHRQQRHRQHDNNDRPTLPAERYEWHVTWGGHELPPSSVRVDDVFAARSISIAPAAPAISQSPSSRAGSRQTSIESGCGCGPDAELTTLGSLATHCNQLLVRWAVALKHRKILATYEDLWCRQEDTGPARHSFKITPSPPQSPGSLSASVWEKVHRWPPMSRTTYCRSP
jgi:hypothetical protein